VVLGVAINLGMMLLLESGVFGRYGTDPTAAFLHLPTSM